MQYSPSCEPNSPSASQEIPHISRKLQVQYRVHNNPSLSPLSARQLQSSPPILLPRHPVHIWDPLSHFVACLLYTMRSCRPAICPSSKREGQPLSAGHLPNIQTRGPASVDCLWLPIKYIHSYDAYLKPVTSIHKPKMCHAVVTHQNTQHMKYTKQYFCS
jgi:hypothetical protein